MQDDLLTTGKAGKLLGVTAQRVRDYIKIGRLKGFKTGIRGHFKVSRRDVENFKVFY